MTEHDDREFDDPASAEVRDLLAQARVTEPVPPAVAARLDETLASLQAARSTPTATVLPLRRRLPRLAAAAAVLVILGAGGVGIAHVASRGPSSSNQSTASAGDRTAAGNGSLGSATPAAPAPSGSAPMSMQDLSGAIKNGLPQLRTASFAADAARVMLAVGTSAYTAASGSGLDSRPSTTARVPTSTTDGRVPAAPPVTTFPQLNGTLDEAATCAGPATTSGDGSVTVPAQLDGRLVALLFRAPTTAGQVVEAWSCDGAHLLASATVPH